MNAATPQTESAPSLPASHAAAVVWNVPNVLSAARLVLAAVFFVAMSLRWHWAAVGLFAVASVTDWLDGFWARRFQQITALGRVLDPLADKVLVCGAFTYLAATPDSCVDAWVAVVVITRELLVTTLRAQVEQSGTAFVTSFAGKAKMTLQCLAILASLLVLAAGGSTGDALGRATTALVWAAAAATVYSAAEYVRAATAHPRSDDPCGGGEP